MTKKELKETNHTSIIYQAYRPMHLAEPNLREYWDGDTRMYENREGKRWDAELYDKNFGVKKGKILPKKVFNNPTERAARIKKQMDTKISPNRELPGDLA